MRYDHYNPNAGVEYKEGHYIDSVCIDGYSTLINPNDHETKDGSEEFPNFYVLFTSLG